MKRISLMFLILLMGCFALAATASDTLSVIVGVKSVFELNVDRAILEVKDIMPGKVATDLPDNEAVRVTVKSNNGVPWFLKISDLTELTDGGRNTIPNSSFFWYGYPGRSARGIWYGKDEQTFSLDPILAYSCASSEYNNFPDGTDLFFKFKISVPPKQNSGLYRTNVAFTVTE